MMHYKTIKERAAEVRAAYKALGYSNRQISVKGEYCGYSTALEISVKDLTIPLKLVKEIAEKHEHVRYDERSYEILSGGNTYVSVSYDFRAIKEAAEKIMVEVEVFLSKSDEVTENHFLVFEEWETEYNIRQLVLEREQNDFLKFTIYDIPKNHKELDSYCLDRIESMPIFTPGGAARAIVQLKTEYKEVK